MLIFVFTQRVLDNVHLYIHVQVLVAITWQISRTAKSIKLKTSSRAPMSQTFKDESLFSNYTRIFIISIFNNITLLCCWPNSL